MENLIGNTTTILKTICMIIAGYSIGYFVSIGLNLPISQEQLSEIIFIIICFIAAYLDAKYPNTFGFLGNDDPIDLATILGYPPEETVLNDEYAYGDDQDGN